MLVLASRSMGRKYENGYRKLIAWQEAKALTLKIYAITKQFPSEEKFGMTSQMRRASSSTMANLAEGSAMTSKAHRSSFYERARGSAVEVDNFVELAFNLAYITEEECDDLCDHAARVSYLITQMIKSS